MATGNLAQYTPPDFEEIRKASRREVAVNQPGTIYFIGGEDGPIKIGITNNLSERLRGFQTGSAVELSVLASHEGDRGDERAYHQWFASHRLRGEWFERHPAIMERIKFIKWYTKKPR